MGGGIVRRGGIVRGGGNCKGRRYCKGRGYCKGRWYREGSRERGYGWIRVYEHGFSFSFITMCPKVILY